MEKENKRWLFAFCYCLSCLQLKKGLHVYFYKFTVYFYLLQNWVFLLTAWYLTDFKNDFKVFKMFNGSILGFICSNKKFKRGRGYIEKQEFTECYNNVECCIGMSWVSSVVHPSGDVWQFTDWVESVHWKLWYRRVYNKFLQMCFFTKCVPVNEK